MYIHVVYYLKILENVFNNHNVDISEKSMQHRSDFIKILYNGDIYILNTLESLGDFIKDVKICNFVILEIAADCSIHPNPFSHIIRPLLFIWDVQKHQPVV